MLTNFYYVPIIIQGFHLIHCNLYIIIFDKTFLENYLPVYIFEIESYIQRVPYKEDLLNNLFSFAMSHLIGKFFLFSKSQLI